MTITSRDGKVGRGYLSVLSDNDPSDVAATITLVCRLR